MPCKLLGIGWDPAKVVTQEPEAGESRVEMRGVLVWADPWDASNWELTEGFLRKWGWIFQGATDIIEASNGWRARRGEEGLVVEL